MEERIADIVDQLSLDEKALLTAGMDDWRVEGIPRLGIGRIKMSDGPTGVRGDLTSGVAAVNFPVGSALGASWDVDLVAEVATTLADEAASKGAHVVLGPTVNLHRYPLAGRNFECYSEDPELTAELAISFITALQSGGVAASLKHFVCNDQEHERHTISSEVDERTLREVYLRPFEAAVTGATPWTIMGAYNRLNGTYCCEHDRLLNSILKGEWQYDGLVVSDWYATHDTVPSALGGLDIQMPGPAAQFGPALADAVRNGEVPEEALVDKATRVVRLAARTGRLEDTAEPAERAVDTPERRQLARRAARSGMVLLTNDGALPLNDSDLASIAVIGPNATPGQTQGGGSSQVLPHHVVSPLDGLRVRFEADVTYERGVGLGMFAPPIDPGLLSGGWTAAYWDDPDFEGDPFRVETVDEARFSFFGTPIPRLGRGHFSARWTATLTPDQGGPWQLSVAGAGQLRVLVDGEAVVDGWDDPGPVMVVLPNLLEEQTGTVELTQGQPVEVVIELRAAKRGVLPHLRFGAFPPDPDLEFQRAVESAAAADVAVVVVGTSPDFETEGEDRQSFELPGRQNELVSAVAAAQPNTVVVVNAGAAAPLPWAEEVRSVLWTWYPGQEFGDALADVLSGDQEPAGRLPSTFPRRIEDSGAHSSYPGTDGKVTYDEGVFIGHRWFDEHDIEPQFCFGHGLSYTTFEYADLKVDDDGDVLSVSLALTNVGERRGSEVVQIYISDVESSVPRPPRELKAFAKVHLLAGETRRESFSLGDRALSFYDVDSATWKLEPGEFELQVGSSSRDIKLRATVTR